MKNIYRKLLLVGTSIPAIMTPIILSSCAQKEENIKDKNDRNLIKSVEILRNSYKMFIDNTNSFYTKLILDTKNNEFLAPIAKNVYNELSIDDHSGKFQNDFFDYFNNIQNIDNFSKKMNNSFAHLIQGMSQVNINNPIQLKQYLNKLRQQLADLYKNIQSTYNFILNAALKIDEKKAKELQASYNESLKTGPYKIYDFTFISKLLVETEMKSYIMNSMLMDLSNADSKLKSQINSTLQKSTQWANDWNNKLEKYDIHKVLATEIKTLQNMSKDLFDGFYSNSDIFYSKYSKSVIENRIPESLVKEIFNKNPIYISYHLDNNNVETNIPTADEILANDKISENATKAINSLVTDFDNSGRTLNPTYKKDNFLNGQDIQLTLGYSDGSSNRNDTPLLDAKLFSRDQNTNNFAFDASIENGIAQEFSKSSTNNVIKIKVPFKYISLFNSLLISPSKQGYQDFYETTKLLPFGLQGISVLNSYKLKLNQATEDNTLVLGSQFAWMEGNRTSSNLWDIFIFSNYNFTLLSSENTSDLVLDLYIGIDDQLAQRALNQYQDMSSFSKEKQAFDNEEITLDSKYVDWVKVFYILPYNTYIKNTNDKSLSEEAYYNQELSKYIKDGKIKRSTWVSTLNSISSYLDDVPNTDKKVLAPEEVDKINKLILSINETLKNMDIPVEELIVKFKEINKELSKIDNIGHKYLSDEEIDNYINNVAQLREDEVKELSKDKAADLFKSRVTAYISKYLYSFINLLKDHMKTFNDWLAQPKTQLLNITNSSDYESAKKNINKMINENVQNAPIPIQDVEIIFSIKNIIK
ncbi:hypothetical protein [Mycoplasma sp. Z244C]